ncbi:MAG: porin [Selenomonadaceae bacterium]|nr:porin [Selenomonadaceae bacterium]
MKKIIVSALASAVILGSTPTSFAAQNPFSDVNEHHWAYQSVTELAEAGIITGYDNSDPSLNGKFLGGRNITRYEMAQMIAKTLARIEGESGPLAIHLVGHQWTFVDNSGVRRVVDGTVLPFQLSNGAKVDQKVLDDILNLCIEFRTEMDALGMRIEDLEAHSDKVVWTGEARYRYWNNKTNVDGGDDDKTTRNQVQFRIFPTATINANWKAKARLTASVDMSEDSTSNVKLTYIYAEGTYGKFGINVGKMPFYTLADEGLFMDDFFSGVELTYGDKFKGILHGGRWQLGNSRMGLSDSSSFGGVELLYNDGKRFNFGAGYHHFKSDDFSNAAGYGDTDKASIVTVGAGYKFGDFKISAAYAKNTKADDFSKAYNFALNYAGANRNKKGSWGAELAYRYVADNVSFAPTYDSHGMLSNKKGVDFGLTWTPIKNTFTKVSYFHGKTLGTNETTKTFYGRVSFFF